MSRFESESAFEASSQAQTEAIDSESSTKEVLEQSNIRFEQAIEQYSASHADEFVIKNQSWEERIDWTHFAPNQEGHSYPRTLIFEECTFHNKFYITQCDFRSITLKFKNCKFNEDWSGGERRGKVSRRSTFGVLKFESCQFERLRLIKASVESLMLDSCIEPNSYLDLQGGNFHQIQVDNCALQSIVASQCSIGDSVVIRGSNSRIEVVTFEEATFQNSHTSVTQEDTKKHFLFREANIEFLNFKNANLPGAEVGISQCTIGEFIAGKIRTQQRTRDKLALSLSVGSISIVGGHVFAVGMKDIEVERDLQFMQVKELQDVFLDNVQIERLEWQDLLSNPNFKTVNLTVKKKWTWDNVHCAQWDGQQTSFPPETVMYRAHFQEQVYLQGSSCNGTITCKNCDFNDIADCKDLNVKHIQCKSTHFRSTTNFDNSNFQSVDFLDCNFHKSVSFDNTIFYKLPKKPHTFHRTVFHGEVSLRNIGLKSHLRFCRGNSLEGAAVFHQRVMITVDTTSTSRLRKDVNINMNGVECKSGATITGELEKKKSKVRLLLRRTKITDLTVVGSFKKLDLKQAHVLGTNATPLLQNWRNGSVHFHRATLSNVTLQFACAFENAKSFDDTNLFARGATLNDVGFTGQFVGKWRLLDCTIRNLRCHDLVLDSDMDLSGSSVQQDKTVVAFSNVQFRKRRRLYAHGNKPKLFIRHSDLLRNLTFADSCHLGALNLRGSSLHNLDMKDGICEELLVRQGMKGHIQFRFHPSTLPGLAEAFHRSKRHNTLSTETDTEDALTPELIYELQQWIQQEFELLFRTNAKQKGEEEQKSAYNISVLFDADENEQPAEENDDDESIEIPIEHVMELQTEEEPNKETFAPSILALDIEEITEKSEPKEKGTGKVKWVSQISTKALFEAGAQVDGLSSQADGMLRLDSKPPLENERAGTPEDEQMTSPEVYNDEEEHCFYIGLWRQIEEKETDTEKDAEELDETEEENPWQEIDLSRHQHSPFHFIRRELEHYFRGTRIENWNLSDFVIEGSDSFETKQARPVFTNVSMQGSTLKGGILNSVVVDGFFEATSACAFDGCEWKGCEFRGPVRLYRSEIPNTLTFLGCSFADNVELAWMRCYGQVRFLRCNLKGTLNLRENRVSYLWNFEDTEFTGPVTIEREQGSGGLRLFECEFTKTFQIRKSDWNGNLDLSRSFFGDEVLLKVVKFPTLNENRLQQTATGMEIIRATDQTGKINLTGSFFSKLCSFKDVEAKSITASDEKHLTQFKGDVEFRNVALTHHMFCGHARFAGPLTLEDVSAPDFVSFLGCEFSQNVLVQRMQNEPSLSFIRSSFAERLLLEDPNGLRNIFVGRTTCHGPVIVRGTLTPQDDLPIESLEQNSLYSITFSETQCTEPVTLENLSVESTIDFRKTLFTKDLTIQNVIFHGEIHATGRLRRHKICGQIRLEEVEVHNLLSLRELHRCTVMLDNAHVRDELDIRSFSKKRPLHCSLSEASITTITFPNDPIDSIGFALPLPEEVEDPKQLPMLCQQKAQHYSQLYQLSLQRKQYEEAKEFRYHYRKALKGLSFVQRYKYLRDMREFEDHGSNTKTSHPHKSQSATLHRLAGSAHTEKLPVRKRSGWIQTFAALWESLIIQFGHTYDGYGKSPLKVLMWLLAFNSLCVFHGLFGWGFEKIGVVWLDTLLTPIGFLFQGVGLRPFGSRFPSMPQQIAFYTHTILVGLMWLYFLRLLIPGLVGRDKISQMLSKRTGSV